jgi:hypothetical protein
MQTVHTIQRSDQKRINEVKRIRSALASGKSLLTDAERGIILLCAQILEMNREGKVKEASLYSGRKGEKILFLS